METIDEEVTAKTLDFMERAKKADKPFFIWWNSTRMHIFTDLKPESQGKPGLGTYADGMVEHDGHIGQLLAKLKELGLEDNTVDVLHRQWLGISFFGPMVVPPCSVARKNTDWEGGYRVPTAIRWPGVIKPGTVINEVGSHEDMLPTLFAAHRRCQRQRRLVKGQEGRPGDFGTTSMVITCCRT